MPGAVIALTPAMHVQVIRADGRSDEWYVALDGVYALSFSGPDAYDRAETCREELESILVEPTPAIDAVGER